MPSGTVEQHSNRVALVIGNSEYAAKLRNPVRDAALITDQLLTLGFHVVGGAGERAHEGENLDRGRMLWLIDHFLREIKGFHDEALGGKWKGFRSSRLNEQWRVIYRVVADVLLVQVVRVTPHDYRRS